MKILKKLINRSLNKFVRNRCKINKIINLKKNGSTFQTLQALSRLSTYISNNIFKSQIRNKGFNSIKNKIFKFL